MEMGQMIGAEPFGKMLTLCWVGLRMVWWRLTGLAFQVSAEVGTSQRERQERAGGSRR